MGIISQRVQNLGESATIRMAQIAADLKAQGKDVISLSLGEPDFPTPDFVKEAAKKAIDENYSYYPPVPGYPELKEAICKKFKRDNGIDYSPNQVVVSTGAKHSIMNIVMCMVDPGDEVILPAPYWVSYFEMVKFAEGNPIVVEADITSDFKITPEQLEKAITKKTKLFIFSNPCNPSGTVYTKQELSKLADVFAKHPHVYVVSDEIYEYITFDEPNVSMAIFENIKDRVITVNGLSKGYAMTGWRLGYIGAPVEIAKACGKIQGQFTSGANSIAQRAAITALENPEKVEYMREKFMSRRNMFHELLSTVPGMKVNMPQGAFYLFPDVSGIFGKSAAGGSKIETSDDVCAYLLESQMVATTPGSAFGLPECIRLSYANSDEQLKEAARRIKLAFTALS